MARRRTDRREELVEVATINEKPQFCNEGGEPGGVGADGVEEFTNPLQVSELSAPPQSVEYVILWQFVG
jgi:hypothetical protein